MTTHYLKCAQPHYGDVIDGNKHVEIRLDDRNYCSQDRLRLMEFVDGRFTGDTVLVVVSHVLRGFIGLAEGYCAMSLCERGTQNIYKPDHCILMHRNQQKI